jgi:hypothetical protein
MERSLVVRLYALIVLAMASSGCEMIGGIFKAGMWTGGLLVVIVVGLVLFAVLKMKR